MLHNRDEPSTQPLNSNQFSRFCRKQPRDRRTGTPRYGIIGRNLPARYVISGRTLARQHVIKVHPR